MKWDGEAYFGASLILFRGHSVANALHSMPVTVLAISHDARSVILDHRARPAGGAICLIRPKTPHMVAPERPLTIAFLSPGRRLVTGAGIEREEAGFAQLLPELPALDPHLNLIELAVRLERLFPLDNRGMDARLGSALDLLAREPGSVRVAEAAEAVGVSPSRLRALAQRDLGASLSDWLLWKKLEQAAQCVATGDGLAQSAVSGGFVDQAHFANSMRRLLGTAPSEIEPVRRLT